MWDMRGGGVRVAPRFLTRVDDSSGWGLICSLSADVGVK